MNAVIATAKINEVFRTNVRAAMETKGVSMRGMAKDLGISYPGLHTFLSGKGGVSLDRAAMIAGYLELRLADLIEGYEDAEATP